MGKIESIERHEAYCHQDQPENCWDKLHCGRTPGGRNEKEYGLCPTYLAEHLSGTNRGKAGGRSCFAIDGTFTQILTSSIAGFRRYSCSSCPQLRCIIEQEGKGFTGRRGIRKTAA